MEKKLIKELWEEVIQLLAKAISLTEKANLQNDQDILNYIDEVNRLSVEI